MRITSALSALTALLSISISACHQSHAADEKKHDHAEGHDHHEQNRIVTTNPIAKDMTVTQSYVCQIRSKNHTQISARAFGILDEIPVKEGQWVEKGAVLFRIAPQLYQAKYDAEVAEYQVALQEYENTKRLAEQTIPGATTPVVSQRELAIYKAKLAKALANVKKAETELNFATVHAPFDGIVDRQLQQVGSTVKEGEILTTLSDNTTMWVRFNVPEARYLEFMYGLDQDKDRSTQNLRDWMNKNTKIELVLADNSHFPNPGTLGTIEADFNNLTGNINFRADFPNPSHILRHGQTGTVLIHSTLHDAIVIPQRATFEILEKRYVFVVGEDHVVHQRQIQVKQELDDIFIIKNGIGVNDKIILEGVRQVHDGQKLGECDYCKPEEALSHLKNPAE